MYTGIRAGGGGGTDRLTSSTRRARYCFLRPAVAEESTGGADAYIVASSSDRACPDMVKIVVPIGRVNTSRGRILKAPACQVWPTNRVRSEIDTKSRCVLKAFV